MIVTKLMAGRLLHFFILLLAFSSLTRGQSGPSGTLSGTVNDASGAVMPGVTVTAKNMGTGFTRVVTTDGGRSLDYCGIARGQLSRFLRNCRDSRN